MVLEIGTTYMAEDGDDDPDAIVNVHRDMPDSDRFIRVMAWEVPESDAYPEGIKYRMHYGTYDVETIVRYDNSHAEAKGHERHTADGSEEIDFPGWKELLVRFRREVNKHELEND